MRLRLLILLFLSLGVLFVCLKMMLPSDTGYQDYEVSTSEDGQVVVNRVPWWRLSGRQGQERIYVVLGFGCLTVAGSLAVYGWLSGRRSLRRARTTTGPGEPGRPTG